MNAASRALEVDLYELTMAQLYFEDGLTPQSYFEVTIRRAPQHWGFFVMAGLSEVVDYLKTYRFTEEHIGYLRTLGHFSEEFLEFLAAFTPACSVRAMPEGRVFFAGEPVLEVGAPLITAQLLETYLLNILGGNIMCATAAWRFRKAAGEASLLDFSLRRSPGPLAARRLAYGAQLAGFTGTSNVAAAKALSFHPSGTMAHSFVQASATEMDAFLRFGRRYGRDAVLVVDTEDAVAGIHHAARAADSLLHADPPVRIRGIRIDSGDLLELSQYARQYFDDMGVPFMKIYVSGALDELAIAQLVGRSAPIDGFGVGTRFASAADGQCLDIVYKPVCIGEREVWKRSPGKQTLPGRKSVERRQSDASFLGDAVRRMAAPHAASGDLLQPLEQDGPVSVAEARDRLSSDLEMLPAGATRLVDPEPYPVTIAV